jgi:site-specific recombinase XerD
MKFTRQAGSESEYVFVKEDGVTPLKETKTAFYAACRRAKLKDVTLHVLRHTFASRLVMNGTDLQTVHDRWMEEHKYGGALFSLERQAQG